MRAWELDGAGTRRVFESHPRHSFNELADTSMKPHGRRVPGCRIQSMFRMGFGQALKLTPWAPFETEVPGQPAR